MVHINILLSLLVVLGIFSSIGVDDYHNQGITGDGVSIGLLDVDRNDHANKSLEVLNRIAPGADITYRVSSQANLSYFLSNDYDIIVTPLLWRTNYHLINNKPILLTSAGNNGVQGYPAIDDNWVSVGSYRFPSVCLDDDCGPSLVDYGTHADVYGLDGIMTSYGMYHGTSAGVVSLAGMIALKMSNDESFEFNGQKFMLRDEPETDEIDSSFSDTAGHRFEQSIERFVNRGVIKGYGDGTFGPDDPITRGQFTEMLSRFLDTLEIKE